MLKERIIWADIVKYICIMCVIMTHLDARTDCLYEFYSPFFLTSFFFISGYVYKHRIGFKNLIYRKIRGLLVPWFVFSTLIIVSSHVVSFNSHDSMVDELIWNFLQIRQLHDELWFVAALFVAFIPFYWVVDCYENCSYVHKKVFVITLLFVASFFSVCFVKFFPATLLPWNKTALPWHLEFVFQAIFYMFLGYLYSKKRCCFPIEKISPLITFFVGWLVYFGLCFGPQVNFINAHLVVKLFYSYGLQLLGIWQIVITAKIIPSNRYFLFVGQNTLLYFALHGKCLSVIQTILNKYFYETYQSVLVNELQSSLLTIIIAVLISVLLIPPSMFINRFFPFLLGKSK